MGRPTSLLLLSFLAWFHFINASPSLRHAPLPLNRDHDPEENMTTPEIVQYWGYPSESVQVTTDDGYVLTLHRIPHGKKNKETKGVIFLQHGLLMSSSGWITNLPNLALGFMAADAGLDVWMGNMRGNVYSRGHTSLNASDTKFWQWSWDEMTKYDLDAMISKVLEVTGQSDLYYVGHSQGTLTMFAKLGMDEAFNSKIRKFFALAPVGQQRHVEGLMELLGKDFYVESELLLQLLGPGEFMSDSDFIHSFAEKYCQNTEHDETCDNVLFMIGGPDSNQMNYSRTDVFLCDFPAGTSSVNMLHFLQTGHSGFMQMFDYGNAASNTAHYGQATPPVYDITKIKAETHLYYGDSDWLADKQDVEEFLLTNLPKEAMVEAVELHDYEHFDFVWGNRAAEEIYKPMINNILADIASRR